MPTKSMEEMKKIMAQQNLELNKLLAEADKETKLSVDKALEKAAELQTLTKKESD